MMTPLHFEQLHQEEWSELEIAIGSVGTQTVAKSMSLPPAPGARVALLYRRACEHLALARARAYPAYIVDRLERITEDAHQLIYHRPEVGLGRLRRVLAYEFPASVRAHRRYVAVAAAVFVLPTLIVGVLVYARPELILSVVSAETAASFEDMYSPAARVDRARADRVNRLDHVRLLHPQQHRRLVPVLRRRAVRGSRHAVLPRLQRRVRGRARRLSRRARAVVDVLLLRRHAFGVRADRHRAVRRRRAAHRPLAARAGPAAPPARARARGPGHGRPALRRRRAAHRRGLRRGVLVLGALAAAGRQVCASPRSAGPR